LRQDRRGDLRVERAQAGFEIVHVVTSRRSSASAALTRRGAPGAGGAGAGGARGGGGAEEGGDLGGGQVEDVVERDRQPPPLGQRADPRPQLVVVGRRVRGGAGRGHPRPAGARAPPGGGGC